MKNLFREGRFNKSYLLILFHYIYKKKLDDENQWKKLKILINKKQLLRKDTRRQTEQEENFSKLIHTFQAGFGRRKTKKNQTKNRKKTFEKFQKVSSLNSYLTKKNSVFCFFLIT